MPQYSRDFGKLRQVVNDILDFLKKSSAPVLKEKSIVLFKNHAFMALATFRDHPNDINNDMKAFGAIKNLITELEKIGENGKETAEIISKMIWK